MSRTKGHGFEREIAKSLRDIFPAAKRHLEYQDGEANGVDISGTDHYKIQCKRMAKSVPMSKISEIKEAGTHVLVSRVDRERTMVTMYYDDWIEMARFIEEKTQTSDDHE